MKTPVRIFLLIIAVTQLGMVAAKDKQQPDGPHPVQPVGWLDLHAASHAMSVHEGDLQRATRVLAQGTLLPVFKTKERRGITLAQVEALNLATGSSELGWVEINSSDLKPAESYPPDDELLGLLGAPYLDDFTAEHTDIARFLVRQSSGPPALACYVVTMPLSMAKLVIFTPYKGKFLRGPALNIPISDLEAGLTSIEVRDLLGDGTDCLITKEPFREQAQTSGTVLCIRKVVNGQFQLLWRAPLEFQNLSQYNPKMQILQPAEKNIGAPGTVTKGTVDFRPIGTGQEPVWKGKVQFFVAGRDKPVNSIDIEKVCPWNGEVFAPLR